jgi:hypothetical protein
MDISAFDRVFTRYINDISVEIVSSENHTIPQRDTVAGVA